MFMSVRQIEEAYDQDLETNLSWIRKIFKVTDENIEFKGRGERIIIIVTPDSKIMNQYKDTSSDVKLFEQYKSEIWEKIRIFSLYFFHFKKDHITISLRRKLELVTY